ncbi:MAG TPA: DNA-formamidopyrimidine glycosylase family protein [Chitinophaga sp.]|uniref:DNA-formamidopyrimidine glycosylase family protein n=1 Tax=Chitinophaga sp. TaxID=1869181 RepID=UPI002C18494B|nr:DNA-formamidopyrimidine glycosylase family protein [Chitinophaga sp.]HVI47661.1 DNA-formamidopyrimidine glycosylase family protein [Chitinophaga sp.]
MPELPDLQVFRHNLGKALLHKELKAIHVINKKKLHTTEEVLKKALEGQHLKAIERIGKELHFVFSNKHVLGMHLMLNGKLYLYHALNEQRHTIATLLFTDGTGLALTDFQGQAALTLDPEEKAAPDALSDVVDETWMRAVLAKKKITIKKFLLDQKNILGIGNAYADDILWDARISPFSICNKIPEQKVKALVKSIRYILTNAEKLIRKHHPDLIHGEVRDYMLVHNHKLQKSPGGAEILHDTSSGRKTYYTAEQELYA